MAAESYILLTQEGHLFQSCLAQGLTDLRNATISEKGRFYTGSFQLSIGLERLMKTILVIEHMANNSLSTPTLNQLKSHGHRLIDLFDAMRRIGATMPECPLQSMSDGSKPYQILKLLDGFARRTRYFNLDSLAESQSTVDPLVDWCSLYDQILRDDVSTKRKERAMHQAALLSTAMSGMAVVVGHDLEKNELDLRAVMEQPQLQYMAAAYAVYYVIAIVAPLRGVLSHVTDAARHVNMSINAPDSVPYMTEFLDWAWFDKPYIMRKKRWP